METIAFALPLTPGKAEEWRRWSADELLGSHRSEYEASRHRLGITAERTYYQSTPYGELVIVRIDALDVRRAFQGMATSQDPFMLWFGQRAQELFSGDL